MMRQFSAGNQWLSAGGKVAFGGRKVAPGPLLRHARACPGHPRLTSLKAPKTWMAGTSPAMTEHRGSTLLEDQPAHEIPLAQGHAVGTQDVVGGSGVEIEIRQRE